MKIKTLDKLWKELLFALSGFGPSLLMIIVGAYFTDAINPSSLPIGSAMAISSNGYIYILPLIFPILIMIAKMIDGLVDIPIANYIDNLDSKIGRRRLPIMIGVVPMIISYMMFWWMISDNQTIMTIWITIWIVIFFVSYSVNLISFYGSIAEVCVDSNQRFRVSAFKAFFDTIAYSLAYAVVPVLLTQSFRINNLSLVLTPLLLTIIIPLFIIKKDFDYNKNFAKEDKKTKEVIETEKIGLFKSLSLTFKNKAFMRWMAVNSASFFGLQIFLVSMNALIIGGMGFSGLGMTILNTFAFAPIPIMLYFVRKIRDGKGLRFAYQMALVLFAVSIFSFFFASEYFLGTNKVVIQYVIGILGGIAGSFAIGSFLLLPTLLPSQIGAHEHTLKNVNQSSMFFAVQALITTLIGAISSGLIYENIKMLFIDKVSNKIIYAYNIEDAILKFGDGAQVYNFGLLLVPFIVSISCIVGLILSFRMPRNFTLREVAILNGGEEILNQNPKLEYNDAHQTKEIDSFTINIVLYFLSGTIFGLIWRYEIMKKAYKDKPVLWFVLSLIFPPLFIYITYKMSKKLEFSKQKTTMLTILSCFIGLNLIVYIFFDRHLYKSKVKVNLEAVTV